MIDSKHDEYYHRSNQSVTEKTVTIAPGEGKAVGLGMYQTSLQGPDVKLSYQPDLSDDIGVSHERLDVPGQSQYILLYQFQNFSQKQCRITMRLAHDS
jgi:hypothetical protein